MMRAVPLSVVLILIATTLGAGIAGSQGPPDETGGPGCLPGNALENDNVRLWFHGFKGFVKVFDKTDGNDSKLYQYTTGKVIEEDGSGDGVAEMNLGRAFPQSSGCTIEQDGNITRVNLTVEEDVRLTDGGNIGTATVTFSYAFNQSGNGAKFDLVVVDWPWQTEDGLLAYAFTVQSEDYDMVVAENGIGFQNETGEPRGHISWADNATAYYDDNSQQEANVTSETNQTDDKVDVTLRFTNVTAGYHTLEYDPWAGMGDWIVVLGRLYSLDAVEAAVPLGLYRTARNLL